MGNTNDKNTNKIEESIEEMKRRKNKIVRNEILASLSSTSSDTLSNLNIFLEYFGNENDKDFLFRISIGNGPYLTRSKFPYLYILFIESKTTEEINELLTVGKIIGNSTLVRLCDIGLEAKKIYNKKTEEILEASRYIIENKKKADIPCVHKPKVFDADDVLELIDLALLEYEDKYEDKDEDKDEDEKPRKKRTRITIDV